MKKMNFVLFVILLLALIVMPVQAASSRAQEFAKFRIIVGGDTYVVEPRQTMTSRRMDVDGDVVEEYEATVEIDFRMNKKGEIGIYKPGIQPKSTIQEDEQFLSKAVKWVGTIVYDKKTIDSNTTYQYRSYKHKLIVQDSNFALKTLNAFGGATGYGYDTANNNERGFREFIKNLTRNDPVSGTTYTKKINSKFAFIRGEGHMNSYGTFKYYRVNEAGQPIRTSPEFMVELF